MTTLPVRACVRPPLLDREASASTSARSSLGTPAFARFSSLASFGWCLTSARIRRSWDDRQIWAASLGQVHHREIAMSNVAAMKNRTLLHPDARAEILRRIEALTPESDRKLRIIIFVNSASRTEVWQTRLFLRC
jgi:hypothetical protein